MLMVNQYTAVPEQLLLLKGLLLFLAFFIYSFETPSVFVLKTLKQTSDVVD